MVNSKTGRVRKKTNLKTAPVKNPTKKKVVKSGELDFTFLTLVIVIVCVGLVMVLSASSPRALRLTGDSFHFFKKQLLFAIVGFIGMIVISRIDYKKYENYVGIFMLICLVLLAAVLIPGVGVMHNGSRRWLPLPGFELQPSEFMKPVMAMFIAKKIQEKAYNPTKLAGMLRLFVMLAGGIKLRYFITAIIALAPVAIMYVMNDPVRSKRIMVALNPFLDKQGTGYQAVQGLYSIASGGLFGQGLGQSIQKTSFLPEPYNDFIFAVVCEELGLLGAILVIVLFCALIIRGIMIAIHAPDAFSSLTVVGIMSHIAIQTLFNICVVATLIPNTGITLPFFSYGGTAIIVLMAEMGIVLNISRHRVRNKS